MNILIFFISLAWTQDFDYSQFTRYNSKFNATQLKTRITAFLQKTNTVGNYYSFKPGQFVLKNQNGTEEFNLKLLTKNFATKTMKVITPYRKKIRIALDPGHFGGAYSILEARHFHQFPSAENNHRDILVKEGNINFLTAKVLKEQLEAIGIEVMLTRSGIGESAFGKNYDEWYDQDLNTFIDNKVAEVPAVSRERERTRLRALSKEEMFYHFNLADLQKRADLINEYKPDLSISIHYNSCGKQIDNQTYLAAPANFTMVFVGGSLGGSYFKNKNYRYHFLRMLLTDHVDKAVIMAKHLVLEFKKNLNIPIVDPTKHIAPYLKNSSMKHVEGVYSRGLFMTREIESAAILGEASCMDFPNEGVQLQHGEVTENSPRIQAVAKSYFNAVKKSFNLK
ncbi:MAG: N-acetylmuramoyl-L-alanine amidase [Bacteriovoracaceae bacterium]|nr:N-acetylmuramoyl-L-alanine amidase [Bacteriovoracaceae bacterium]